MVSKTNQRSVIFDYGLVDKYRQDITIIMESEVHGSRTHQVIPPPPEVHLNYNQLTPALSYQLYITRKTIHT